MKIPGITYIDNCLMFSAFGTGSSYTYKCNVCKPGFFPDGGYDATSPRFY